METGRTRPMLGIRSESLTTTRPILSELLTVDEALTVGERKRVGVLHDSTEE
jgi:hypothetical protein